MSDPLREAIIQSALELAARADPTARASSTNALQQEVLAHFDASGPRLRRYVRSFGLDAHAAQDVVQEAFLALFRHLRLGRPRDHLTGWLFRVAHNLSLKHRQRLRRRRECALDEPTIARLLDATADPESRTLSAERWRRVRAILATLPERDRQCLSLRAEGLSYRDIAGVLGVSLGTVAKSIARSLAHLAHEE